MNSPSLADFIVSSVRYAAEHPEQRAGQAAFNALSQFDYRMADDIYGTGCDPFHDDRNLPDFWHYVMERMS